MHVDALENIRRRVASGSNVNSDRAAALARAAAAGEEGRCIKDLWFQLHALAIEDAYDESQGFATGRPLVPERAGPRIDGARAPRCKRWT